MSDIRDFHAALSRLAYAHASNTLRYILGEARRIDDQSQARIACAVCEQLLDLGRVADMFCDPSIRYLAHGPDGTILNISEQQAASMGHAKSDLLGACIWSLFQPDAVARRKAMAETVLAPSLIVS